MYLLSAVETGPSLIKAENSSLGSVDLDTPLGKLTWYLECDSYATYTVSQLKLQSASQFRKKSDQKEAGVLKANERTAEADILKGLIGLWQTSKIVSLQFCIESHSCTQKEIQFKLSKKGPTKRLLRLNY